MFDMLKTLKKYLLNNATIAQHCTGRIRAYTYDETADRSNHYILIDPLVTPQPETYASDEYDTDLKLYMDARRYRGNPYTIDGLRHIDKNI